MTIIIKTGNAAFSEDEAAECVRILRELIRKLAVQGMPAPGDPWALHDVNGNRVGDVER